MTKKEFYEKFKIHFHDTIEEYAFLGSLDKLYLEYTEEQAIEIIKLFYKNADDIYNDARAEAEEHIKDAANKLKEFVKSLNEKDLEEDEEDLDKAYEA